ncbi:MAG: 4-oxalomesaconate tautomerase [Robiginitomaculum sp.]|nr:MAG: 4-oxalomesaconate tautomerase [Robiginitomaculum sp.]
MQTAIPTTLMRGGTSKGLFFSAADLPTEVPLRDAVLLAVMGSPDVRQIDGAGGAHPLTSKVAIVSPSPHPDADVDYLFLQVAVDKAEVSTAQNCGNILAGVGPWAIENGMVDVTGVVTKVRIHMLNTGSHADAHVPTPHGIVVYEGNTAIDGVPGTHAAIPLDFLDVAGASTGALLPTGNKIDTINGTQLTCIDNGMPVVLLRASDFGKTGHESPAEMEGDEALCKRIEAIRLAIGPRMNLGNVAQKTVPKMSLISAPQRGGVVMTQTFIPHRVHEAIGVLGAVSVATGCVIPHCIADGLAQLPPISGTSCRLDIEHPSGAFTVDLDMAITKTGIEVNRSALVRTARKIMRGEVYIPASVWDGQ